MNNYMEFARWCWLELGKTDKATVIELGNDVRDCILHPLKLSKLSVTGNTALQDNIIILDSPTSERPAWNFNGYGCILNKDENQTLASAVANPVTWGAVRKDAYSFYDEVTDNTRITVPTGLDGAYLIQASVAFAADATGIREAQLYVNGFARPEVRTVINNSGAGSITVVNINTTYQLSGGDYIQVYANHNNGSTLALQNASCCISFHKIGS